MVLLFFMACIAISDMMCLKKANDPSKHKKYPIKKNSGIGIEVGMKTSMHSGPLGPCLRTTSVNNCV